MRTAPQREGSREKHPLQPSMLVRVAFRQVDFWLSSAALHTGQLLASELDFIPEPPLTGFNFDGAGDA